MRKPLMFVFVLAVLSFAQSAIAQDQSGPFGSPISSVVMVSFPSSSTEFRPNEHQADYLKDAKNAALVVIRGRTSTNSPSAKDEALALSRALSARTYLIARGVSPLKVQVNFASAADFVADNSTQEGRLQNQRVEVELVYVNLTSAN